jgi:thioredoxin reductase (NADPH)
MRNTELTELHGSQEDGVDHVTLVRHPEGHPTDKLDDPEDAEDVEEFTMDVGAVFYAIGHTPNTEYLQGTGVEMDDAGYLKTRGGFDGGQTATDVTGLFGAGDVVDYHYQQAVTAAGMGCKAAMDADEYLENEVEATAAGGSEAAAESDD